MGADSRFRSAEATFVGNLSPAGPGAGPVPGSHRFRTRSHTNSRTPPLLCEAALALRSRCLRGDCYRRLHGFDTGLDPVVSFHRAVARLGHAELLPTVLLLLGA